MCPKPDDDDDRTVLRGAARADGVDSRFVASSSFWPHTLPEGTKIGGFEITGLIGEGGFGIVYLAWDPQLQRSVAIKEYMPASLASRAGGSMEVSVKSERHRETFEAGLKSFVNEARLLARFDHPSLVKVYRFWEANRTAYMVMPYYEGPTLKAALAERDAPPDESTLRAWLRPLLDALAVMHREHCYHRDIAPDNILLTASGPLLLDFGAARRVIGDMTQALTVVLKPGYAPIEQYGEGSASNQGAWTDLYALASVVHFAITGQAPISSVERIMGDTLEPLVQRAAGRYSEGFLRAIDAALAVRPKDRPQGVAQFRALLNAGLPEGDSGFGPLTQDSRPAPLGPITPAAVAAAAVSNPAAAAPAAAAAPTGPPAARSTVAAAPARVPAPVRAVPAAEPARAAAATDFATPTRSRRGLLVFGTLLFVVAAALVWFVLRSEAPPTTVATPSTPATPSAETATAPSVPPPEAVRPKPVPARIESPKPQAAKPETPKPEAPKAEAAPAEPAAAALPAPKPAPKPTPKAAAERQPERTPERAREPARSEPKAEAPAPSPHPAGAKSARCSDILQKASLEPLSAEEAAFLRSECR